MPVSLDQIFVLEDWKSAKWRLNNLYTIVDANSAVIPFRMNSEQEHFYDNLHYWNVILKARQLGWTTLLCLMALDQVLFNSNFAACVIAHTQEDARKFFEKKIRFAYEKLPRDLKEARPLVRSPAGELWMANGSSVVVDTSARSDTFHFMHISEFGKICAERPETAREIVTGSIPAVAPGNLLFIESTAEGNHGKFYEYVMKAKAKADSRQQLTRMDFKLHFYGWNQRKENVLPPDEAKLVGISQEKLAYFHKSEVACGKVFTREQMAWWIKTEETLGEDMKRENPVSIEEAFEASVEGLIYGKQLTIMRKNNQITIVPWEPGIPVNTFWDLGRSKGNAMAAWCHQRVGLQNRLIRYHEAEGESIGYFANWLKEWGYTFGVHYLPHDGDNILDGESVTTRAQLLRKQIAGDVVVGDRIRDKEDGIEQTRVFLPSCWIDQVNCEQGIKALDNYRRQWNKSLQQNMTEPLHNWASNGADALRTGAQDYVAPYAKGPDGNPRRERRRESWRS